MIKFITKNGKVYIRQPDDSEIYVFNDVKITGIVRNIQTKKVMCNIQFKYGGEVVEECIPRASLLTKRYLLALQDIGLGVTEENAKYMIEYLKKQEENIELKVSHSGIGYEAESHSFNLYKSFPNKSEYDGNSDIKPKGTYENWLNAYNNEVKDKIELQFAIALSASSAIVGIIGKDLGLENPIVHIYGDSSTGKTTAVQLGLSVWGNPNLRSNGLVQNYNETVNSLMHNLRDNNGVTVCFDEISMSTSEDFTSFIYATTNGKEKGRLSNEPGKGYVKLEQATWNTVILSTGEYNILEKAKENDGLKVRVYAIGGLKWTENSENSDKIKSEVINNYGHVGERFVENLIKYDKEELHEKYNSFYQKLVESFKGQNVFDDLTNRRIKYYSIIILTASLLNEHLKFEINLSSVRALLMEIERKSILQRNVGEQAYKKILEIVSKNRRKFPIIEGKRSKRDNVRDDVWGYVLRKDAEVEIFPQDLKRQCSQLGFQSHTVILNKWKQMGILNHEVDRLDRSRGGTQVYVIKVDKQFIEMLSNEDQCLEEKLEEII